MEMQYRSISQLMAAEGTYQIQHSPYPYVNWTSFGNPKVTGFQFETQKLQVSTKPTGGAIVVDAPADGDLIKIIDESTPHTTDGWGDQGPATASYWFKIPWYVSDSILELLTGKGFIVIELNVRVQRLHVVNGREDYYSFDKDKGIVFDINVGNWLKQTVRHLAMSRLTGDWWVFKMIFSGVVDSIPEYMFTIQANWDCWHLLTDKMDTRVQVVCQVQYGHQFGVVSRPRKPRIDTQEGSASDNSSLGDSWDDLREQNT